MKTTANFQFDKEISSEHYLWHLKHRELETCFTMRLVLTMSIRNESNMDFIVFRTFSMVIYNMYLYENPLWTDLSLRQTLILNRIRLLRKFSGSTPTFEKLTSPSETNEDCDIKIGSLFANKTEKVTMNLLNLFLSLHILSCGVIKLSTMLFWKVRKCFNQTCGVSIIE